MRKLALVMVVAAAVVGGLKWHERHATDGSRNIAVNRFWVDHLPTGERDPFKVFVINAPEGFGAFADETEWKGQIERFRFDMDGNTVHAVFPWTDTREDIKVTARTCQEQGMDYCLELSGSSRGVKRYYSRKGWTRRDGEDVEAFKARAF
jgi:hypothetical protein